MDLSREGAHQAGIHRRDDCASGRSPQFAQQGIIDSRTTVGTRLLLENVTVSHNVGTGIAVAATANNAVLDQVYVLDNGTGLAGATGNNVAVKRSVLSGNSGPGVVGDVGAQITVDNSMISGNGIGVQGGGGTIKVSNSDIVFNTAAFSGAVISYGNNRVTGAIGNNPTAAGLGSTDLGQQ